ncbi:pilus assembly protein [Hyphomicrobium sp.]|uniref:TadE/TadG family type IV pilus assembly protein n=1 Tax=Hyphomicrobium sp. TaxID=82 RepID=UPI001E135795|nr:pilus assembly protein [Hyphomicrobium sp.]MBY0560954.1 pilus assembly protein [Hyphomicrobium sp.]
MKFASFSLRRALCGYWKAGDVPAERPSGRTAFYRFAADSRGDVAILFGLMTLVLVMLIGLAVDYGRLVNARNQTLEATDAAVLAGARALQTNGGDQAAAIKVAQAFYKQAVESRLSLVSNSDTINFAVTDNGTAVISNGNAQISTPFMSVAGVKTLPLLHADGSDYAKAVLAVGGNAELNLEVSMMLDVTGSMAGQKLTDLKSAASDLVNIVVWKDQSKYTSKIAIVPFAADVRLPTKIFTKVQSLTSSTSKPCVVERTGAQKATDAAPAANAYFMVDNSKNKSSLTATCDLSNASSELLPLTSDTSALLTKISGLTTYGGTAGHLGTAWAWYMLSPKWKSIWNLVAADAVPAAYGTDKLKKIAVLMTDGVFNTQYNGNGYSVNYVDTPPLNPSCPDATNGCSSAQASALCTQMKAQGIEVYTVGFQLGNSQLAVNTLKNCATDANHFYNSTTGDALKAAFRDIALKISTLYLAQ